MSEQSQPSFLSRLFSVLTAAYLLVLLVYLILRVLVGDSVWWLALLHNFAPFYFLPVIAFAILTLLSGARRLLVWCLLFLVIGAIWIVPPLLPKNITPGDGLKVHLVTFNLYPNNQRMDDVVAWIQEDNPYVIAFQEVNEPLREGLQALHDDYPYRVEQGISERARVLYSKLPVLENSEIDTLDLKHQRVVLNINDRKIAIYNVHLDMPADSKTQIDLPFLPDFIKNYDETRRNDQIEALIAHLKTETLPYIVMGDFNTSSYAPIYGDLAALMQDSYPEAGTGFGFSWPAGEAEELPAGLPLLLRLDYVWHSESIRALQAKTGPVLGSDHLPLVVAIEIAR